jgi:hypothetical protein
MKNLVAILISSAAIAGCGGGGSDAGTCVFGPVACGTAVSSGGAGAPVAPSLFEFAATGANVFITPAREARFSVDATTTRDSANFIVFWPLGGIVATIGSSENPQRFDGIYLIPANTRVEVTAATGVSWRFRELP